MVQEEQASVEREAKWTEKGRTLKEGQTEEGRSTRGPLSLTGAWIGRPYWSTVLS